MGFKGGREEQSMSAEAGESGAGGASGAGGEQALGAACATALEVSWGDCDPAQIVFYPRYFEWFDRSAHSLFRAIGLDPRSMQARWGALGLSLVDARASFRGPARFGDSVVLACRVASIGRSSVTLEHTIRRGAEVLVEGREVRVWLRLRAGAEEAAGLVSAPIPEEARRRLEGQSSA